MVLCGMKPIKIPITLPPVCSLKRMWFFFPSIAPCFKQKWASMQNEKKKEKKKIVESN